MQCLSIFLFASFLFYSFSRRENQVKSCKVFLLWFLFVTPNMCFGANHVIRINNQRGFDRLMHSIDSVYSRFSASSSHEFLIVNIQNGVYFYNDSNRINIEQKNWNNWSIEIIGNSSILVAQGRKYSNENNPNATWDCASYYLDSDGYPHNYERCSNFFMANGTCSIVGSINGDSIMEVQSDDLDTTGFFTANYIQFTEWYSSHTYPIDSINSNTKIVRFICPSNYYRIHNNRADYFPNYDNYASEERANPRFRLIKHPKTTPDGKDLYYCQTGTYIHIVYSRLNSFKISGLEFMCNKKVEYKELFRVCNNLISDNVEIKDCVFRSIKGTAIYLEQTDNVTIEDNHFYDCYHSCIVSRNGCNSTKINHNTFDGCGRGMDQNFNVSCGGSDFLIANNTFTRFSYAAIGVGVDIKEVHSNYISGIVNNNTIDNSGYSSNASIIQHTLMDAGAIYTWCWNDNTIIRDNTIQNYGGMYQYRGIFCDQGTMNVTIAKNEIYNIKEDYITNEADQNLKNNYITIHWREDSDSITAGRHNTGNLCYENTLDVFDYDNIKVNFRITHDHDTIINIDNQNDFNRLSDKLRDLSQDSMKKNIIVRFNPINYYFYDNQIALDNITIPISITFDATGATFYPSMCSGTSLNSNSSQTFLRQEFTTDSIQTAASNWYSWSYASGVIYQASATDYVVPTPNSNCSKSSDDCQGCYIQITEWYTSQIFPIQKIENGLIYFSANGSESISLSRLNYDYSKTYSMPNPIYPRYRIYKARGTKRYADAATLFNFHNSVVAKMHIKGFKVCGNNGTSPLIQSNNFKSAEFLVDSCSFSYIHSNVIEADGTPDLTVSDCTFRDCFSNGVVSNNGCLRTVVKHCTFNRIGDNMDQYFGVVCRGEDFAVEDNTITDFCFGGIGVGVWYGEPDGKLNRGIVRNNTILFSQPYIDNYEYKTLMGGSAIYSWTKTNGIVIDNNDISHIRGVMGYYAIFGENGPNNLLITNNHIHDMHTDKFGHRSFSIELLWVGGSEHNQNNDQSGNWYDGNPIFSDYEYPAIRFQRSDPATTMSADPVFSNTPPNQEGQGDTHPHRSTYYDLFGNQKQSSSGQGIIFKSAGESKDTQRSENKIMNL